MGETAFAYERTEQPLPKLGPWASDLDGLLVANAGKARRERLTLVRIYEELQLTLSRKNVSMMTTSPGRSSGTRTWAT